MKYSNSHTIVQLTRITPSISWALTIGATAAATWMFAGYIGKFSTGQQMLIDSAVIVLVLFMFSALRRRQTNTSIGIQSAGIASLGLFQRPSSKHVAHEITDAHLALMCEEFQLMQEDDIPMHLLGTYKQ